MQILVSFFDKNGKEIFNSDGSLTSFSADMHDYKSATIDALPWDKIEPLINNGFSWESQYVMGSSTRIEPLYTGA